MHECTIRMCVGAFLHWCIVLRGTSVGSVKGVASVRRLRAFFSLTSRAAWEAAVGVWDSDDVTYAASILMMGAAALVLLIALPLVSASQVVGVGWFAGVLREFPGLAVLRGFTVRYATTLLFVLVVGLALWAVPNAKVRFRDVWVGALVTGLLWRAVTATFSWFLTDMTQLTVVNGEIAAVVMFLVWVYVQAVIFLYGVEFTAAYAHLRRAARASVPTRARG